jgi:hypothetical protein
MTRLWGPKSVDEAAAWWVKNVQRGVEFGWRFPNQCLLVRYEDVIRAPEESLTRMLHWLEEPGDAKQILQNYQSGTVQLEQSRIGEWRHKFSDDEKDIFSRGAGELLEQLGYDK